MLECTDARSPFPLGHLPVLLQRNHSLRRFDRSAFDGAAPHHRDVLDSTAGDLRRAGFPMPLMKLRVATRALGRGAPIIPEVATR